VVEVEKRGGGREGSNVFFFLSSSIIGFLFLVFSLSALTDRLFDAARHGGDALMKERERESERATERESERATERESERATERESERVC